LLGIPDTEKLLA